MRIHKRTSPIIFYAAIDPAGGGSGAPSQGAPVGSPTPTPQPGGQGQGQGGFREQFFANVPDEVWGQVEPHVRGVQGHVTQLQQRYAPFKDYRDEDLQGLAEFSNAFSRDPVGQWLRMARGLQQVGRLDEQIDLDHLEALITGQDLEPAPALGQPQNGDMPLWAQQLMQRLDKLEGGVNKFQANHRTQVEDAVLQKQLGTIREGLKKGGIPDDAFDEGTILASYIANRGNANAAVTSLVNARNVLLKGYVRGQDLEPEPVESGDLELPNGAPKPRAATKGRRGGSGNRMIPAKAVAAAEQFLKGQQGSS